MKTRILLYLSMVCFYLIILYSFISLFSIKNSRSDTLRVAIVDTGLNVGDPRLKDRLCKDGYKNFVEDQGIDDVNGHGTFIAGLIQQFAGKSDYCLLIYKYYSDSASGQVNLKHEVEAFNEAIKNKADIVNFSGGGPVFEEEEYLIIKDNPKITFVVSAGNDGHDLDVFGNEFFPASLWLPNEIVVENKKIESKKNTVKKVDSHEDLVISSNYSKKAIKEIGENSKSFLPYGKEGYMTGTSMSTAITTGKLILSRSKSKVIHGR